MISLPNNRRAPLLAFVAFFCVACLAIPADTQTTPAQTTPTRPVRRAPAAAPAINSGLIVLDPGHGGSDDGAQLSSDTPEKTFTLGFAEQLRTLLTEKGFTVVISRTQGTIPAPPPVDADNPNAPPAPVSTVPVVPTEDQRAEQANRLHPLACLLLHGATGGHGIHLFTSSLTPIIATNDILPVLAWNEAQAPTLTQSTDLAADLSTALNGMRVPLVLTRASVPPIDSLTCPAVAIELAPLPATPVTDAAYQRRVAESIVSAMVFWREHVQAEAAQAAVAAEFAAPKAAETPAKKTIPAKPAPKPYYPVKPPAPVLPPVYRPMAPVRPPAPVVPPTPPAPIIRRPPSTATPPGGAQ